MHRVAWDSGKVLPPHIAEKLSHGEVAYFKHYIEIIDEYNKSFSDMGVSNLDLTVDQTPPKDLFIEVRVKQELGAVMLPESGEVNLQKNTTHLLRRSEVDHLIKQGAVAEVK